MFSFKEVENLSDALFSGDEENGGSEERKTEINGNWIPATSITEAKINAKAKRRLRKNSSRDSGRGDSVSENGETQKAGLVVPTSPKGKVLDRRSRSGKGRGLPKKGQCGLVMRVAGKDSVQNAVVVFLLRTAFATHRLCAGTWFFVRQ